MRIGVDIGGTKIRAGLVDQSSVVRGVVTEPCPANSGKMEVIDKIADIISGIISGEVDLIGVGVPAIVDGNGVVYDCVNIPSWDRVELKALLESRFGVPVQVNNDCNCFVKGVAGSKYGKGFSDIVGITLGTGVGAGLILGGEVYTGQNSCAGEIGCMLYKDKDYESYCSGQFFLDRATTAKEEAAKAMAGDPKALRLWEEFGTNVGDLINMVTFAYDPQVIVIGGGVSSAFGLFEGPMRARMASFPYSNVSARLKVFSDASGDFLILGAVL